MDPKEDNELKNYMTALSKKTNDLSKEGYSEQFQVKEGKLCTSDDKVSFASNEVTIIKHYRFEGESDPADMSILYAIETKDGRKGMLVDAFGTYADKGTSDFMKAVEEEENQNHPKQ